MRRLIRIGSPAFGSAGTGWRNASFAAGVLIDGLSTRKAGCPEADEMVRKDALHFGGHRQMSHKTFFQRLAAAVTARDLDHVAEWFTEDFRLHEPGFDIPDGHAGAEVMLRTFLKLGPAMKVEVMDVIEAGDRAAVRWTFSGDRDGEAVTVPCIAMYRFVGGRIAEDWGITSTKGPWP